MSTDEFLQILDKETGASGSEAAVGEAFAALLKKYCARVYKDKAGNVIGVLKEKENAPAVMLEAHMDEVALMVSGITNCGTLKFITLGGFDPKILPGTEVTVHGKTALTGVIGALPPHLKNDAEKSADIADMCIDAGFADKKDAEENVNIGDVVTINTEYTRLLGNMRAARCIDDRGGLAVLLRAAELLFDCETDCTVYVVATVQEELGLRGACRAAYEIKPDYAISVDVGYGISHGVSTDSFDLGKGPIITVGPNTDGEFTQKIMRAASSTGISFQTEACGGSTGTNAWEIQVAAGGVKTALLSIPLRYMHSSFEVCSTDDTEATAQLIAAALRHKEETLCL